jgi:hypothetical protein
VGATYCDEPGFQAITSDDNSRLMVTLPAALLRQKLEALLDGAPVGSVAFQPVFDITQARAPQLGACLTRYLSNWNTPIHY